jgi:hypothetical protein
MFKQSCSSRRKLSNVVSHSLRRCREEVDSRLLVVGSQTDNLTLSPSFAHNLGCRCSNGQCKAILGIYTSRAFHWYKERNKARRFDPSNCLLSFWESRKTPSLPLLGVGVTFSHFAQSGVATTEPTAFWTLLWWTRETSRCIWWWQPATAGKHSNQITLVCRWFGIDVRNPTRVVETNRCYVWVLCWTTISHQCEQD